jgi:acyl-CoA thioester hydrolase
VTQPFERIVTVYWADADAAGIVWFGNFFRYLEETEEELFRARGEERQALLERLGIFMPRTHLDVGFRSPARINERLVIAMTPSAAGPRRISWRFQIRRADGGVVCEGEYRTACVDAKTFEPREFPGEVVAVLG